MNPISTSRVPRASGTRLLTAALGVLALGGAALAAGCSDAKSIARVDFAPAQAGTLRVATALPAPGFWDGGDTAAAIDGGFEYVLAERLAEQFELELEIVEVPFDQIADGDFGGADMAISQISVTRDRATKVEFSTSYFDSAIGVLATTGDEITDLKTARERTWAVVAGSIEEEFLDEIVLPRDTPLLVADEVSAVAAIERGEVDAALVDLPSALVVAAGSDRVQVVAQFVNEQQYAVALPRQGEGRHTNVAAVDTVLRGLQADGSLEQWSDDWLEPRFERSPSSIPVIPARTTRSTP